MSTLPELTDEQIDTAWKRANTPPLTTGYGPVLNRGLPSWRELRAAFPKPKPPEPSWSGGALSVSVAKADEHTLPSAMVYIRLGDDYHYASPRAAVDLADALRECADWIEANQ